jgi:hypothetical protein
MCAETSCNNPLIACAGSAPCLSWLNCIAPCMSADCLHACDAANPTAAPLYGALYTCLCSSCSAACSPLDPCNP